jgi:rhodanese-related sulfurtransferase
MKSIISNTSVIIFYLCLLITSGCVDDNITPPLTGDLNSTAEMLIYLESQGDFPNSSFAPALVEAEEVYTNLNSFLIIDIRSNSEFVTGYIENAKNISTDSLYNFIEAEYDSGYSKIILVSKNGQSSAYFTCLLRLAGFDNVYSMNFGMAAWNEVFADEWLNSLGNYEGIGGFINDPVEKNEFTSLPQIVFTNPDDPIDARVKTRIRETISSGFRQGIEYTSILSTSNQYLVCYGSSLLYKTRKFGVLAGLGHPLNARSYLDSPDFDLRSVNYLQTLPNSQAILLYDYNGQLAACMTAYLRILGYDVKMLLFGANQLFYDRMIDYPELMVFTFSYSRIKNYPYSTGE